MDFRTLFIEAVRADWNVPAILRERAGDVQNLEESLFDESYLEFLETQIRLNARGTEWTGRLTRRLAALRPFCGITMLRGNVIAGSIHFSVRVHPETRAVIHWEKYQDDSV
jgi:hypothetical protein